MQCFVRHYLCIDSVPRLFMHPAVISVIMALVQCSYIYIYVVACSSEGGLFLLLLLTYTCFLWPQFPRNYTYFPPENNNKLLTTLSKVAPVFFSPQNIMSLPAFYKATFYLYI